MGSDPLAVMSCFRQSCRLRSRTGKFRQVQVPANHCGTRKLAIRCHCSIRLILARRAWRSLPRPAVSASGRAPGVRARPRRSPRPERSLPAPGAGSSRMPILGLSECGFAPTWKKLADHPRARVRAAGDTGTTTRRRICNARSPPCTPSQPALIPRWLGRRMRCPASELQPGGAQDAYRSPSARRSTS